MNQTEKIRRIRGAEETLGIRFSTRDRMDACLPQGSRLLGYSGSLYFCFIKDYAETVFAVPDRLGQIWPLAYSFEDFLRLVLACGSAELAAKAVRMSETEFRREQERNLFNHGADLSRVQSSLGLEPIPDPYAYIRTVGQIIDCGPLVFG